MRDLWLRVRRWLRVDSCLLCGEPADGAALFCAEECAAAWDQWADQRL